jgi:hypothetical protein
VRQVPGLGMAVDARAVRVDRTAITFER